jgi:DNA-binding transcriptional LysR family regulator
MDLTQLRSFATVAAEGHVTRASEKLHLSQPTISSHIRMLEEELGVTLFERRARGVTLTRSGKILLEDAQKVLAASLHLRDHARALSGSVDARLHIGTILDAHHLRLGDVISEMRERYKLIQVELQLAVSGVGIDKVLDGELDAAFVLGEPRDSLLRVLPLEKQHYVVVIPHSWAGQIKTWADLAARPWALTPPKGRINQMAHEMLRARALAPASVVIADQESLLRDLVASGVGASFLREDLARNAVNAGEMLIWPEGSADTMLNLVYLRARENSPEIRALLRSVEDVWHTETSGVPNGLPVKATA